MNRFSRLQAHDRTLASILIVATFANLLLALYPRYIDDFPSLSPTMLIHLPLRLWDLGDALAGIAAPVALFYLVSLSHSFRRFIVGAANRRDKLLIFLAFAVIHLLMISWVLIAQAWHDFFVVVTLVPAAYFMGWPLGVGLGCVTMLILGTQNALIYGDPIPVSLFKEGFAAVWPFWVDSFLWNYLLTQEAVIHVWIGLVVGACSQWLGQRRYSPLVGAGIGAGIMLITGYLTMVNLEESAWVTETLAPHVIASGIAMSLMVLMVRTILGIMAEQRVQAAETARIRSELIALRAQINPHFFFNTLNTIRFFIRSDPAQARSLLLDLSEIFQQAIRSGEFVPLHDELRYVEAYLRLETARLGDRLQSEIQKGMDVASELLVPTLISQPLVENAVLHGISKRREGGKVTVLIERRGTVLQIRVEDNGVGMGDERLRAVLEARTTQTAIGLRNVDNRLRALYGPSYGLIIQSTKGIGTSVTIRIPIRDE